MIYKIHGSKYCHQEDDIDKDRYFIKSQFTLIHCDTEDPIEVDGSNP